jgi:glucokinase
MIESVVRNLPKRKYVMGVDLGATWVRVALSDEMGRLVEKSRERIDKSSETAISNQIARLAESVLHKNGIRPKDLEGVGIASAGPLDLKEGRIVKPPNLPFEQVSITKPVANKLNVPIYLINDCTAAVLGERRFGAGKGLDNIVFITIGTGIGGGAIVDGHLLLGKDGNAVEIGHFTIDSQERLKCGCGKQGHWEAYCSGKNIPDFIKMRVEEIEETKVYQSLLLKDVEGDLSRLTSEDLFAAAKKGDALSLQLVEEIGTLNAIGFANVVNAYDPSLITVGGSVVLRNKRLVLPLIRDKAKHYALNRFPRIVATPLAEDVGIYGAIAVVLKFRSQKSIFQKNCAETITSEADV